MTPCPMQTDGLVELYFYDELSSDGRQELARHLPSCADCRAALDELEVISAALAERPRVSAPANGDWSSLMARIERTVALEPPRPLPLVAVPATTAGRRSVAGMLAFAATLALVSSALLYQGLDRRRAAGESAVRLASLTREASSPAVADPAATAAADDRRDAGFAAVSEEHFERSKLVILGLATRDAHAVSSSDWAYERRLAGALLDDTRLYKQTAAARGLGTLADVMSDLELVLLQTSLTDAPDAATLDRLQRLIRQRDLVAKMEVAKWF
ncbi:MAG: hypothetical protein ABIX28_23925 [Vicinamibacterales bacterium]